LHFINQFHNFVEYENLRAAVKIAAEVPVTFIIDIIKLKT